MKPMPDPKRDLKRATPEKLARALLRPLKPRQKTKQTKGKSAMEDWQIVASIIVPIGLLLWGIHSKLDGKITGLTKSLNDLSREISNL